MAEMQAGMNQASTDQLGQARRRNPVERAIEFVANGVGNTVGFLADIGVLFLIFFVFWVAFGAALVWSHGSLDAAWQWVRSLPLLIQAIVWLAFLPVMLGLWIWETTWPLVLRLILVVGIAGWNLIVFLPRALQAPHP